MLEVVENSANLALCFLIVAAIAWPSVRRWRLTALKSRACAQMNDQAFGSTTGRPERSDVGELAAYAGLIAAEYAWSWATIDPDVIRAAAFSSDVHIHNGFQLVDYLHHHYESLGDTGRTGFSDRLLGYVGEQKAAAILHAQGHAIDMAHSSTHPVWDLLVDHHPVNIKTVSDIASIKSEALAHGHVTYLVPEDAHGHAAGNIEVLHGFSHHAADHAVHHAIAAAHGETASHATGLHLPWLTVAFAVRRNWMAVNQGRDVGVAVGFGVTESIGRGGGGMIGSKVGGLIGSALGPVGAVLGAIIGGLGGGIAGGAVAEKIKHKPLRGALDALSASLHDYGGNFAPKLDQIAAYITAPLVRMREALLDLESQVSARQRRIAWWIWPDFRTVLLEEAANFGRHKLSSQEAEARKLLRIIETSRNSRVYTDIGLIMMNAPEISELLGDNACKRAKVVETQKTVFHWRKQLNPAFLPPS